MSSASDKPFAQAQGMQSLADQLRQDLVGVEHVHYKGGRYRVLDIVVAQSLYLQVVYESLDPGPKQGWRWTRPLAEWSERVTDESGSPVKRFTPASRAFDLGGFYVPGK